MYSRPIINTKKPAPLKSMLHQFGVPTAGWVANRALSNPSAMENGQGAAVLDNFFPSATKAVLRRGKQLHATLGVDGDPVTSLFTYSNGLNRKMFGANGSTIYDITNIISPTNWAIVNQDGDRIVTDTGDYFGNTSTIGNEVFENALGGNWITTQFSTSGGVYLIGVNGASEAFIYDGTSFTEYDSVVFPGLYSVTMADMSYVFVYKKRLWFVEKNSLNLWYMKDVDAFAGDAEIYPMGSIFTKGGHILWGESWALDRGASGGLSDQLVIASSEGEVAVFQGTYPEETNSWLPVGVYRLGKPLGNRAHFRGGGDIGAATSVGLVPLSKAVSLDVTALSPASVSYSIQDAWQEAVEQRGMGDWQCLIWPEQKMAIVSPPVTIGSYDPVLFVSNTETGAWCRFTNWDARAMVVFNGELYFGGPGGEVFKGNVSGMDGAATFTGVYIPLFDDLGSPASRKIPKVGRGYSRAAAPLNYSLRFRSDFNDNPGPPPTATAVTGGTVWGEAVWGESSWGEEASSRMTLDWKSLGGQGYSCSLAYLVTSGSNTPLDAEIIRLEMTYTTSTVIS